MPYNLSILFRGMDPSRSAEAEVRRRAGELDDFSNRIASCRVTLEAPHRRRHQGKLYEVHIDIAVPGRHVLVTRGHDVNHQHENLYVAIRDAFDAARRQLQDQR
jgi:ribosome-associated translation inhibitor RaiA